MSRVLMILAVGSLGLFPLCARAAEKSPPQTPRSVHAFYYPWYRNPKVDGGYQHWNHAVSVRNGPPRSFPGGDDIGANFYPQLGCYSTNDREVVRLHMQQMRDAGIEVVCTSWWGPRSDTDKNLQLLFDEAARAGLTVNFHLEPFAGRNAKTTRAAIVRLIDKFGDHPGLYRSPEKRRPMFYIYDSYLVPDADWATILAPGGAETIRGTKYDCVMIGLWVKDNDGRRMLAAHFDGFYTYFASDGFTYGSTTENWHKLARWAEEHQRLFIPCVAPGYNDLRIRPWNRKNLRGRENGAYYDRMFRAAIDVKPAAIGVTSFNEWHEGTQIEPAVSKTIPGYRYEDYGDRPADYYLTRTRYWSDKFRR